MPDRSELHQENLRKIFYPSSIAVVGATKTKGTVPYDILENILKADIDAAVYPVSPREKHIAGVRAYKYVLDIDDQVDLAIIVFPSAVAHMALEQCGQKGIKSVIIISAGFKEIGEKGLEREKQILEIARKYDMSFIGPNCLGVINTDPAIRLNASFARQMPEEGSIGFLSQSGALCTAVLDYARAKHIGFSKFISFGNKADISEVDLMYYLMRDEKTKVILMYLEEVTDGRALMKAAKDIVSQSGKPVLILKSGRTMEGASAAASHTGSLAGSDEICDAAFEQAGIIRCDNIEEMFNNAIAFAYQPPPETNKVAIITNAGGPGVLTTDAAIREGLQLARFSEETTRIFKRYLPSTANIKNPVDVIGDARADRYDAALTGSMKDPSVAGVFVILTPQSMTNIEEIAEEVVKVARESVKPLYTSFMGEADVAGGVDILLRNKIPHYILPESMCKSFASVYRFHHHIMNLNAGPVIMNEYDRTLASGIISGHLSNQKTFLAEDEAGEILKIYGLPVLPGGLAASQTQAGEIAEKIGYPVVLKVMSDDLTHKSDIGGVRLDLKSSEDVREAYNSLKMAIKGKIPESKIRGIWVTPMISGDVEEIIIGIKRDPSFGPVIMFGLGGIFVEILKDISLKVAPLSEQDAEDMIRRIKGFPILSGVRGRVPRDIESIKNCLFRIAQLAVEHPEIKELDINPLMVRPNGQGSVIADAKIMF
ncbi:MAG: acetate--CoA ligase family protein [Cyclobacteriaceae bacterium]|nr:acetate--CoA ligase family protein [Cyclobacteriaceae bacterium]